MLVLTRKVGEQINIGDEIVVRVIEVNRGNVKIGIDAPASVSIYRQEVYEKIQEQNVQASRGIMTDLENVADLFGNKASKERIIDS